MRRLEYSSLRRLGLASLPVLALAALGAQQAGGGWQISAKSTGTTARSGASTVPWSGSSWHVGANGGGNAAATTSYPGSGTATSSGQVELRLDWTGSGTAPTYGWLRVRSYGHWDSEYGSGSVTNAFGDPYQTQTATGGSKDGYRILRFKNGASRAFSISASFSLTPPSGSLDGSASEACQVEGQLTDKSVTLSRTDGGIIAEADPTPPTNATDSFYTADTLLSWDVDNRPGIPANNPDPTYQTLRGQYGGTWSQKTLAGPNNTTIPADDTEVQWNGATPAGIETIGPIPSKPRPSETTYPSLTNGGKMPTADLATCAKQTQTWSYKVTDKGPNDGSVLSLKCLWTCHFAYENFRSGSSSSQMIAFFEGSVVSVTSQSPSSQSILPAGSYTCRTGFEDHSSNSEVPGFTVQLRHVGIQDVQAHYADTTPLSWLQTQFTCTKRSTDPSPSYYRVRRRILQTVYDGVVDAWNRKGAKAEPSFSYWLGNSGTYSDYQVPVDIDGGA